MSHDLGVPVRCAKCGSTALAIGPAEEVPVNTSCPHGFLEATRAMCPICAHDTRVRTGGAASSLPSALEAQPSGKAEAAALLAFAEAHVCNVDRISARRWYVRADHAEFRVSATEESLLEALRVAHSKWQAELRRRAAAEANMATLDALESPSRPSRPS